MHSLRSHEAYFLLDTFTTHTFKKKDYYRLKQVLRKRKQIGIIGSNGGDGFFQGNQRKLLFGGDIWIEN